MTSLHDLRSVLKTIHGIFVQNEVWHCLIFGTLLGAVRDGGLIEWDHDIDLLIRPADVPRILQLEDDFEREGIHLWVGRGTGSWLALNPARVPWFELGCLGILYEGRHAGELWAPTLFADGFLRSFDVENGIFLWPEATFSAFFVETLEAVELDGERYPVPANAGTLLSFLYGKGWNVPYRSSLDGGEARDDLTRHGLRAAPSVPEQVAWCTANGWDRSRYAGQPSWPRPIRGAGPLDQSTRTAATSGSAWWHTLDELAANC